MDPDLAAVVADLAQRVTRLEDDRGERTPHPRPDLDLVPALVRELPEDEDPAGLVVYAGVARDGRDRVAWQMGRTWGDLVSADAARLAAPFAALAAPARVRLLQRLVAGEGTTTELTGVLDDASTGQLYHHLGQLLAAGLVSQPRRGVYAIPAHRLVPVVAVLAVAADLAVAGDA